MNIVIKRFTAPLCVFGILLVLLAGCGPDRKTGPGSTGSTETTAAASADKITVLYNEEDLDDSYDTETSVSVTLCGDACSVEGSGAVWKNGTLTVSAAGTYVLSGTLTDGQICVDAAKTDVVRLVLNGVDISCSDSAPIVAMQCEKTMLILADDAQNRLADAKTYVYDDASADEPDAALFAFDDLTVCGTGSLMVEAGYKNGICSKDDLVITGGTITVTAPNDAIKGRDSVAVYAGTFTVDAGGDAIVSTNDEDTSKGTVSLDGGTYHLTAAGDAVQAETVLQISAGDFTVKTGGGSAGAVHAAEPLFGREAETSASPETASAKGLKAGLAVYVTGGTFLLDTSGDAIHSNGSVSIEGGSLKISAGDDGIHADTALRIENGDVTITKSYEGLESAAIELSGGTVRLTASDDGINASGGSAEAMRGDKFGAEDGVYARISGGYLSVDAGGDGLDSNGNLYVSGGTILMCGPTNDGNGPMDYNGTSEITGGILVAAGSAGMAQNFTDASGQSALLVVYSKTQSAGTLIGLCGEDGNAIVTFAPSKQYSSVVISAPGLTDGKTCTLYSGGSSSGSVSDGLYTGGVYSPGTALFEIKLSGVTSVTDSGETYGGGMAPDGMGPGGDPGQRGRFRGFR